MNSRTLYLAAIFFSLVAGCSATSDGSHPVDSEGERVVGGTCASAGGTCVAVVPGSCEGGDLGSAELCGGAVGVACCIPSRNICSPLDFPKSTSDSIGMANPAAVYCQAMGYTSVGESCQFPDGESCEQWSFFRGACGQGQSFCARQGGTVSNVEVDMGGWTGSIAECVMPSGARCSEQAFARTCVCDDGI